MRGKPQISESRPPPGAPPQIKTPIKKGVRLRLRERLKPLRYALALSLAVFMISIPLSMGIIKLFSSFQPNLSGARGIYLLALLLDLGLLLSLCLVSLVAALVLVFRLVSVIPLLVLLLQVFSVGAGLALESSAAYVCDRKGRCERMDSCAMSQAHCGYGKQCDGGRCRISLAFIGGKATSTALMMGAGFGCFALVRGWRAKRRRKRANKEF